MPNTTRSHKHVCPRAHRVECDNTLGPRLGEVNEASDTSGRIFRMLSGSVYACKGGGESYLVVGQRGVRLVEESAKRALTRLSHVRMELLLQRAVHPLELRGAHVGLHRQHRVPGNWTLGSPTPFFWTERATTGFRTSSANYDAPSRQKKAPQLTSRRSPRCFPPAQPKSLGVGIARPPPAGEARCCGAPASS